MCIRDRVNAELSDGSRDIMLFASNGKAVRFAGDSVRPMGRTATGVRGMKPVSYTHLDVYKRQLFG